MSTRARDGDERHGLSSTAGVSTVELIFMLGLLAILAMVGHEVYRQFFMGSVVDRAARAVAADVSRARSYAVQRRANVAMVVNEADRSYAVRDESSHPPDTLFTARYDEEFGLPLNRLEVLGAPSLTWNSRGILEEGSAELQLEYRGTRKRVLVNRLGRTKVEPK